MNLMESNLNKCLKCDENSEEIRILSCNHQFCQICLNKAWKAKLKKESPPIFSCIYNDCDRVASISVVEIVLSEHSLKKIKRKKCEKCENLFIPIKLSCYHEICIYCKNSKNRVKRSLKNQMIPKCENEDCKKNFDLKTLYQLGLDNKYIGIFLNLTKIQTIIPEEQAKNSKKIENEIQNLIPKEKMKNHLKKETIAPEEKEKNHLKKKKEIQCQICYEFKEKENFLQLLCNHEFCKTCLKKEFTSKIFSNQSELICPKSECRKEINFYILKDFLPKDLFEKYDCLLLNTSLYNQQKNPEKIITCPGCKTSYMIWENASYFTCIICKKTICSNVQCFGDWDKHEKLSCLEYKKKWLRNGKNEAFEKMKEENKWVYCPKCKATIEKIKGCNYVKCESNICQKKTIFCSLCSEVLNENDLKNHFLNGNVFGKCKIKCSACECEDENNFKIFENKYFSCAKCRNKTYCMKCKLELVEEFKESHLKSCFHLEANEGGLFKSFLNKLLSGYEENPICPYCQNSKNFKKLKFFKLCLLCPKSIFCRKCNKEIDDEKKFSQHMIDCFYDECSSDYLKEKNELDVNHKNLSNDIVICRICENKDQNNYIKNGIFFTCKNCDYNMYCVKCNKLVVKEEKEEHFLKIGSCNKKR